MKKIAIAATVLAFGLTGCQGVSVPAGQKAILVDTYSMIPTDPEIFKCQDAETTEQFWNVREFDYPNRNISYKANGDEDHERDAFVVVSNASAPAELRVPVTVTFELTQDCDKLKQFHRDFGTKYLPQDEDKVIVDKNDGWVNLLNYVIGQPLEQTLINISQKYTWREIWNDEKVRGEYVAALQKRLPEEAKARTNGTDYFTGFTVTVGKPDPVDDGLKKAIINEQTAIANAKATEAQGVADANARKAKADADVQAATAETKVAEQEALTKRADILGFPDVESYLRAQCIKVAPSCTPWPQPIIAGAR